jgi:hypothetical protein
LLTLTKTKSPPPDGLSFKPSGGGDFAARGGCAVPARKKMRKICPLWQQKRISLVEACTDGHAKNTRKRATTMTIEFQVQKAGLGGDNWTTVCRAPEVRAREVFQRQLRLYSVGRFRLLDASGRVLEERKAAPLFSAN